MANPAKLPPLLKKPVAVSSPGSFWNEADDRLDDRIPDDDGQQDDRRGDQEEGEPALAGGDLLAALLGPIAFCQLLFFS